MTEQERNQIIIIELLEIAEILVSMIQSNTHNPKEVTKRTNVLIGSWKTKQYGKGILGQALAILKADQEPVEKQAEEGMCKMGFEPAEEPQSEFVRRARLIASHEIGKPRNTMEKTILEACDRLEAETTKNKQMQKLVMAIIQTVLIGAF